MPIVTIGSHQPWWKKYMAIEWAFTIVAWILLFIYGSLGKPYCREFSWNDQTINYKHKPDTFPSWSLPIMEVLPIFVYIAWGYFANLGPTEINVWALCQVQASALMEVMVGPSKFYAGRLRPDFLDRLRIEGYTPNSVFDACALDSSLIEGGRKSFPSGHSSTAFSAMIPLALFLFHQLKVATHGSLVRLLAALSPLVLSFVVAISRTRDNRHHFADILAGSIMGIVAGVLALSLRFRWSSTRRVRDAQPLGGDLVVRRTTMVPIEDEDAPVQIRADSYMADTEMMR